MTTGEEFSKVRKRPDTSSCLQEMQEDEFLGSAKEAGVCDSFCL